MLKYKKNGGKIISQTNVMRKRLNINGREEKEADKKSEFNGSEKTYSVFRAVQEKPRI